jgi:hypothetical protein
VSRRIFEDFALAVRAYVAGDGMVGVSAAAD